MTNYTKSATAGLMALCGWLLACLALYLRFGLWVALLSFGALLVTLGVGMAVSAEEQRKAERLEQFRVAFRKANIDNSN